MPSSENLLDAGIDGKYFFSYFIKNGHHKKIIIILLTILDLNQTQKGQKVHIQDIQV